MSKLIRKFLPGNHYQAPVEKKAYSAVEAALTGPLPPITEEKSPERGPVDICEYHDEMVTHRLRTLTDQHKVLTAEKARVTEELQQTEIAISAFTKAHEVLTSANAGDEAKEDILRYVSRRKLEQETAET